MNAFQIIAHRGTSGEAPENSLASIKIALQEEVDRIEIDVQQTHDGKIVLLHDDTIDRTTNGTGFIGDMSYADLKEIDSGSWFSPEFSSERIPLLKDALSLIRGNANLIVEVKNGSAMFPNIEESIWDEIKKFDMENSVVISSTRIMILNRFKEIAPDVSLAKIISQKELWRSLFQKDSFLQKQGLLTNIKELHAHWSFIEKNFMENARNHDLKVYAWTVDKERKMRVLADRGIDGVITNYPKLAARIFRK